MKTAIDTMLEQDDDHEADVRSLQQALALHCRSSSYGYGDFDGYGDWDSAGISDEARAAFEDMLKVIRERGSTLTKKQRAWVCHVLTENGIADERDLNLVSRGLVPRGPEVDLPDALKHRPLTPPGGKRFGR